MKQISRRLTGVDRLWAAAAGRPVDALLANAGHGLGRAFLDQDFEDVRHVIDTNVTGTVYLVQLVGRSMRSRGQGRILLTGSIAGFMPGTYQAVYNGTKAFVDSFSFALRAELKDTGVTVTCLMPGATETDFFERADMLDTKVGQGKEGRPRGRGACRLRRHDARRWRRGERLEKQAPVGDRERHARRECSPSSIGRWPNLALGSTPTTEAVHVRWRDQQRATGSDPIGPGRQTPSPSRGRHCY